MDWKPATGRLGPREIMTLSSGWELVAFQDGLWRIMRAGNPYEEQARGRENDIGLAKARALAVYAALTREL